MLAYAARRPAFERRPHPNTLLMIIGAHVGLLALAMSAKMEIERHKPEAPIVVQTLSDPLPPPPNEPVKVRQTIKTVPIENWVEHVTLPTQTHVPDLGPVDIGAAMTGDSVEATTIIKLPDPPRPLATPVRSGARLLTPQSELKPPYPAAKLLNEEEAVLKLRLTVNDQGRVIAVDPVDRADPAFLDAARRHLIAHWRYKPASEDGRAISSTVFVTLNFQLDG